jgi:hypothetical protein
MMNRGSMGGAFMSDGADEASATSGWRPITAGQATARNRVLAAARSGSGGRFAIIAESGCGKTVLLGELATTLRGLGHAVLFITCPASAAARRQGVDQQWAVLETCKTLISKLSSGVEPQQIADEMLSAALRTDGETGVTINELSGTASNVVQARDIAGGVHLHVDDTANIPHRLDAMRDRFASAIEGLATGHPLAVLVDELQLLDRSSMDWLWGVLARSAGALIICAHWPSAAELVRKPFEPFALAAMTEKEIVEQVVARLSGWSAEQAEAIATRMRIRAGVARYPAWVATWCQMINESLPPGSPIEAVEDLLDGGTASPDITNFVRRFGEFVDHRAERLVGRRLPLFDYLTVLRRVIEPETDQVNGRSLLARLLDLTEDQAKVLFRWLRDSQFMTDFNGDKELGIRLHDRFRLHAADELAVIDSQRYGDLHRAVERCYRELVNLDDEADDGSAWGRYDNPAWQRDSEDWLHYLEHVDRSDFRAIAPSLVRLFLEVFWWYNTETPSDYCSALLADYRVLAEAHDLRTNGADEWLRRLEELHAGYVWHWEDRALGRRVENWAAVDAALWALWNMHNLDSERIPGDLVLRRMQSLLCSFLGDAAWWGHPGDEQSRQEADAWYAACVRACTAKADQRIAVWADFGRADLWAEAGRIDDALRLVEDLPERIDAIPEHGLWAGLARLHADIAWQQRDYLRAFDIHGRAVLLGYAFNVRQTVDGTPPDSYTLLFYQQMIERMRWRLDEARNSGLGDIADQAVERMGKLFEPYRKRWPEDIMVANMFPPGPQPDELYRFDTPFYFKAKRMLMIMKIQLDARPVDAPLDFR